MHQLRNLAETETWRLLRVLFLWNGALSADPAGRQGQVLLELLSNNLSSALHIPSQASGCTAIKCAPVRTTVLNTPIIRFPCPHWRGYFGITLLGAGLYYLVDQNEK